MKIDEVVSDLVDKRDRIYATALSFSLWALVAYGVMTFSFTLGDIAREFELSKFETSTLVSSTFFGMLIGALSSGIVADYLGRKYAIVFYSIFSSLFTGLFAFSRSYSALLNFRFLSGVGYGGILPVVSTYLNEFSPKGTRGRNVVILESMWAIGSIILGIVDVSVGFKNWRVDYELALFGFVLVAMALYAKESPKFVFVRGGKEALEKLLNRRIREEIEEIPKERIPLKALFKRDYIRITLMIWVVWFVLSFVYYGLFIYLPNIFKAKGVGEIGSTWFTFFMMIAQLPGYLSAAYFIERIGRKRSLTIYLLGTGISALAFALAKNIAGFLTSALLTSFFCLGAWGLTYAYTPELYPTPFRGTANGSAGTMTRIGGMVAPYAMTYLMSGGKVFGALLLLSSMSVISAVIVWIFGVETKGKDIG